VLHQSASRCFPNASIAALKRSRPTSAPFQTKRSRRPLSEVDYGVAARQRDNCETVAGTVDCNWIPLYRSMLPSMLGIFKGECFL